MPSEPRGTVHEPSPAASLAAEQTPNQTQVSLRRSQSGKRVIAHIAPGNQPAKLDHDWLVEALERAGLAGAAISKSGILQLQRMVACNEGGEIEIGQCHDATVEIQVSQDRLLAKLIMRTARGGENNATEQVTEVIEHAKIARNLIDHQAIERLLSAARTATPGATLQVVIAHGQTAVDGLNSTFEPLVSISERRPAERDDGSLDYRDLGEIPTVKPGDALMRRHPPTKGVDGFDVTGAVIKAKDGRKLQFERHSGTAVSDQNPDLLLATITGQPVLQKAGASVDPVLKVADVNMRSGHIEYEGTLVVSGSISPGMRVRVTGDAQILGMVECAELDIGGNLDVKMGISGPTDNARGEGAVMRVRCGGNLTAGHVEKAQLDVQGDIIIKSQLTHSEVACGHRLVVGSSGQPRSGIVGGRAQAAGLIRVQSLGTEAGITTEITLGCSAKLMRRLEDCNETIAFKQAELGRLLKAMVGLSRSAAKDAQAQIAKVNAACNTLKAELGTTTIERDQVQADIDALLNSVIEVPGTVYPRVLITIGENSHEITQRADQVRFCQIGGRLRQVPLKPDKKTKAQPTARNGRA